MLIKDDKKLKEIQAEFHERFPYLRLEFYSRHHEINEGSPIRQVLKGEKTIGEARKVHNAGELSIDGHQKVSTLEQNFFEMYDLNVQVFRRSGGVWLQTTKTDDWTLAEQNDRGKSETEFYAETHGI